MAVDDILRALSRPICWQTHMRKGPSNSSPDSRRRSRTAPQGDDTARAGIRALDCGNELSADARTVVRRDAAEGAPAPGPTDSGALGEQGQSI